MRHMAPALALALAPVFAIQIARTRWTSKKKRDVVCSAQAHVTPSYPRPNPSAKLMSCWQGNAKWHWPCVLTAKITYRPFTDQQKNKPDEQRTDGDRWQRNQKKKNCGTTDQVDSTKSCRVSALRPQNSRNNNNNCSANAFWSANLVRWTFFGEAGSFWCFLLDSFFGRIRPLFRTT